MTIEEIRELIHVVNESGIAELEVQRGENRVRIRRTQRDRHVGFTPMEAQPAAAAPPPAAPAAPNTGSAPPAPAENELLIKTPTVAPFFETRTPRRPPF